MAGTSDGRCLGIVGMLILLGMIWLVLRSSAQEPDWLFSFWPASDSPEAGASSVVMHTETSITTSTEALK